MKQKVIALAGMIIIALVVGYMIFLLLRKDDSQDSDLPEGENNVLQEMQTIDTSEGDTKMLVENTIYTNSEYGFEITLLPEWSDYKAISIAARDGNPAYIKFYFPTTDSNWPTDINPEMGEQLSGYASMFTIGVWNRSDWEKGAKNAQCIPPVPGCPSEYVVVGASPQYVYDLAPAQDLPDDLSKLYQNNIGDYSAYMKKYFKVLE